MLIANLYVRLDGHALPDDLLLGLAFEFFFQIDICENPDTLEHEQAKDSKIDCRMRPAFSLTSSDARQWILFIAWRRKDVESRR